MGSGPLEEVEFGDLLSSFDIEAQPIGPETEVLILGRTDLNWEEIEDLIGHRSGQQLRIYSQEMFLSFMLTGANPLLASAEVVDAFREGHPVLERLSQGWSGWVSTFVEKGKGAGDLRADWPQQGVLSCMGYRVGQGGRPAVTRQAILRRALTERLPNVSSPAYMDEWGDPSTCDRLRKMAESIAAFCKNMKRKHDPSAEAIDDWETDLEWLRHTFYLGKCQFHWPETFI